MMEERSLEQEAWECGLTMESCQNGTPGLGKGQYDNERCGGP